MTRDLRAACALALLSFATAACLPRGEPPAGRQLVADRTATLLGLLPASGDGVLRALFLRPGQCPDSADLYVLSVGAGGEPPSEHLLLADVPTLFELGCSRAGGRCYALDRRGRLYVPKLLEAGSFGTELLRVDPVTGEARDLGVGSSRTESESGDRVLVFNHTGGSVLYEADDSTTVIDGNEANPTFVGEVLFYQTVEGDLMRFPPGGAPVRVATGLSAFNPRGPLLALSRRTSDPAVTTQTIFDPSTLEEVTLPAGIEPIDIASVSPDGRWIGASSPIPPAGGGTPGQTFPATGGFVLLDRTTGTIETLDPSFRFFPSWRPGHTELWASSYDDVSASSLLIKRPGEPTVVVAGIDLTYESEDGGAGSAFTADGAYWFARGLPRTELATSDRVGTADDPAGPVFDLVPENRTASTYFRLADGRFLVEIYTSLEDVFENFDVRAVDPRTGDSRLIGERGFVAAVGRTRVLGIFHVIYERGDLTTVDLGSGQSTVLAHEFAMAAFAEPQGTDPHPPGGRVVFQFRARFDSPFDGIWLATAP